MNELSPRQRDMVAARQRIKYKYARPYLEWTDGPCEKELRERLNTIIANEMSDEERELLEKDLHLEMQRIRDYHDAVELPEH